MLGAFVKNVDWRDVFSFLWDVIQAGASGIADAVDEFFYGDAKTRQSVSQLYENQNMDLNKRVEIQMSVASGKKYANSSSLEGLGVDKNQLTDYRTRIQQLEDTIAAYKEAAQNDEYNLYLSKEDYDRYIAKFEQELAELLEADGMSVTVNQTVVQQPNDVTTNNGDVADGTTGGTSKSEKLDQLIEAIQNKDSKLVVQIGTQTITELALKGMPWFNAQYGNGG
jgi:tetratricopeptide (TPR) repeat protein